MKKLILAASTMAILLLPALAHAQVAIRFGWVAPPPVVEVSPGVQVVEDSGDEVFFSGGHYYVEREGRWYWANDYHDHWVAVRPGRVPVFIRNHPRGQYLHWRRAEHVRAEERHDERRDERRDVRHDVRAEEHHDAAVNHEVRHEERREHDHHE
jgi:hypothetical protein